MTGWQEFTEEAPRIAAVFERRHRAAGNLCLLATLRADGSPRISPMEPRIFEGRLVLVGMPNTRKFADLDRDPRFSLHTATIDPHVGDGDAKVWGMVRDEQDLDLHRRFAEALLADTDMDLRAARFAPFRVADLAGASSVEFVEGELTIRIWAPGQGERAQPLG